MLALIVISVFALLWIAHRHMGERPARRRVAVRVRDHRHPTRHRRPPRG